MHATLFSNRTTPPILEATAYLETMQKLLPDPTYLLWLSDGDVWVEQWPIIEPKLSVLKELVKEQLDFVHLEPSTRRHNTPPIFVIQKRSGHYQLLQDLCAINDQMEMMRTTQACLSHPSAIHSSCYMLC